MTQTKAQLLGPVHNNIAGDVNFDSNTLFVDSANNRLGIGTNSPAVALHVIGDITMEDNSPRLEMHDANAANNLSCTGGIELFDSAGNRGAYMGATEGANFLSFGISSTAGAQPTEKLRITSSGYIKLSGRNVTGSANGSKLLRIYQPSRTDSEQDVLLLQSYNQETANEIIIGGGDSSYNAATDISFRTDAINTTSGTERLHITSTGNILPGGNKTQDLGSSSNSFANVYAGNIELSDDYPSIKPSLNLNFAGARALDPRITFTRASTGTYVGRDGLIKTAGEDEARFDHDPVTLESLGLLIEESRTNLITYSEDYSGGSWVKTGGVTVTANDATAPDGTTTADRVDYDGSASSGSYRIYTTPGTTVNGTKYITSIWMKSDTPVTVRLSGNGTASGGAIIICNVTTEWQRFSTNGGTGNGTTSIQHLIYSNTSSNASFSIYVWGSQMEIGTFTTSYIPTSGSTVTRAADTAKIEGNSFTDWYNPLESTIYFESSVAPTSNSKYFTFQGDDGGGTELIESAAVSGPGANVFTYCDGNIRANVSVTDSGATKLKYATGVIKDNVNVAINGTLGTADTSAVHPDSINKLIIGNYSNGSYYLNTTIQRLTYYPKRFTDAQLQLLTS